jgi:hypothetical protein
MVAQREPNPQLSWRGLLVRRSSCRCRYFNAGQFELPVAGFTHLKNAKNVTEWSAYRFHEQDPLKFADGLRLTWRCGDAVSEKTGLKCYTPTGGKVVGSPTCDSVVSYAWVYEWPNH